LENKHSISPMDNIMETLHTTGKGWMMDTLERFYIFQEAKINNQINDRLTIKPNIIFETIVQKDPHRGLTTACKHLSNSNWFSLTRSPLVPTRKGPCNRKHHLKVTHPLQEQPLQRISADSHHHIQFSTQPQRYRFPISNRNT
jgi:hypothetical protein